MKLANLLVEQHVTMNLRARTKEEAVKELLDMLVEEGVQLDFPKIIDSVREREEIEDTSYGHGFAFPHARTDAVKELFILVGVSKAGLQGRTADNVPLHVVCLLLTPSTIARLYLQTLSGMASLARTKGILDQILSFDHPLDFIKMVAERNIVVDKELMVRDVMRYRVASVTPDDTLKEVANKMFKFRLSAVAVVDRNNKLLGVINDRDVIKVALKNYESLISNNASAANVEPMEELLKNEDKIKVSELYRSEYDVTTPETRIVEVAAMMIFKDVRRVFVVSGEQLVGVLLRKDMVNMIIRG
jgi:mannitol/fructose-specific phosphotransferase system IIA component (Ntr-type)/CBS domain-containing protein